MASFLIVFEGKFIYQSLLGNNLPPLTLEFNALGNNDTNHAKRPVGFAIRLKQGLWASWWDVRCQTQPQGPAAAPVFMKAQPSSVGLSFSVFPCGPVVDVTGQGVSGSSLCFLI